MAIKKYSQIFVSTKTTNSHWQYSQLLCSIHSYNLSFFQKMFAERYYCGWSLMICMSITTKSVCVVIFVLGSHPTREQKNHAKSAVAMTLQKCDLTQPGTNWNANVLFCYSCPSVVLCEVRASSYWFKAMWW